MAHTDTSQTTERNMNIIDSQPHRRKLKVAFAYPKLYLGGAEARVMWGITALKDDYDVSLITCGDVNLEKLNQFYGTSLEPTDFTVLRSLALFLLWKYRRAAALRASLYQKFCKRVADDFDVLISACNLCDFGVPAIHFIVDFSWNGEIKQSYDADLVRTKCISPVDNLLHKGCSWVAGKVSKASGRNLFAGEDLIVANSRWTARQMSDKYGIKLGVIYPPVTPNFPRVAWENKEPGFVCLGRIARVKKIERMIDILAGVRKRGHDIHLHIIGNIGEDSYGKSVSRLCREHSNWIIPEGQLFGEKKQKLLAVHRFGIHGCRVEGFGISVAEMIKAGCITFVPKQGGAAEIVNNPLLTYEDTDDAVRKIDAMLRDHSLQNELRNHLTSESQRFSTDSFQEELKKLVRAWLTRKGTIRR